jgi:hypothetical protein
VGHVGREPNNALNAAHSRVTRLAEQAARRGARALARALDAQNMMLRIVLVISSIGLVAAGLLVAQSVMGPTYEIAPLRCPITFDGRPIDCMPFSVGRTETYLVEVNFDNNPQLPVEPIIGDGVQHGALEVTWEMSQGDVIIARGTSRDAGYSTFSGETLGATIGTVAARTGRTYQLRVTPRNIEPRWNELHPFVEVRLHPAKLEYRIVDFFLGIALCVLSGAVLASCVGILLYRRKQRGVPIASAGI